MCETGRAYAFMVSSHEGDPATYLVDAIHPKVMLLIRCDDKIEQVRRSAK